MLVWVAFVGLLSGAEPFATVKTPMGMLRGIKTADYRMFLGIQYAEAPVKKLRWKAPVGNGKCMCTTTRRHQKCSWI